MRRVGFFSKLTELNAIIFLLFLVVNLNSCAYLNKKNPNLNLPEYNLSTTGVGAATGAALGAGLGLVVGSTTGDAGEGLVIGGIAGAATGAAIGKQLENQENMINQQQEILTRQQETVGNQRRELEELKRSIGGDSVRKVSKSTLPAQQITASNLDLTSIRQDYQGNPRAKPWPESRQKLARQEPPREEVQKQELKYPILATTNVSTSNQTVERIGSVTKELPPAVEVIPSKDTQVQVKDLITTNESNTSPIIEPEITEASLNNNNKEILDDPNCQRAQQEAGRLGLATSEADRLFYLRRALRLCPTNPEFHVQVGKIYASLGRKADAQVEFRQALDLDPGNKEAEEQLTIMDR